jgi:ribosomal protein L11 methyltransferase
MKQDYLKIVFPKDPKIGRILDLMMETGEIISYEQNVHNFIVLDMWENRDALLKTMNEKFPNTQWTESKLEDRDWNQEWINGFQPIKIAKKLWVSPPWHEQKIPINDERIIINPGNAFGTGTHESTLLAMKLLKTMISVNDEVMDLGCGSGILSIAAMKLGASNVFALDFDPEIANNITENLQLNNMNNIQWEIGDVLEMQNFKCDLALINIQKHVILPLLERFSVAKDIPNRVILAGLLNVHRKDIRNALKSQGYKILKIYRKKDWIAVSAVLRRKNEK